MSNILDLNAADRKYDSKFNAWYAEAWVRKPQLTYKAAESGKSYFSRKLFPLAQQPGIVERGDAFTEQLLLQRFFQYATFTSVLERRAVNPAVTLITEGLSGVEIPFPLRRDAGKILSDESFHALESDAVLDAVEMQAATEPIHFGTPSFLKKLERLTAGRSAADQRLLGLGFAFVSETLISTLLKFIPNDETVVQPVRDYVREHDHDETRHYHFFKDFFALWWPRISAAERELVGPLLPHFIRWFLEPDLAPFAVLLQSQGFDKASTERLITETLAGKHAMKSLRQNAAQTVHVVLGAGAFEMAPVADAFAEVLNLTPADLGGVR